MNKQRWPFLVLGLLIPLMGLTSCDIQFFKYQLDTPEATFLGKTLTWDDVRADFYQIRYKADDELIAETTACYYVFETLPEDGFYAYVTACYERQNMQFHDSKPSSDVFISDAEALMNITGRLADLTVPAAQPAVAVTGINPLMQIVIEERTRSLNIYLHNAEIGGIVASVPGSFVTYLTLSGSNQVHGLDATVETLALPGIDIGRLTIIGDTLATVEISGGQGWAGSDANANGACGVQAQRLIIDASVTIRGGHGNTGKSGLNGSMGSESSQGGNGTDGGRGGDGANGLITESLTINGDKMLRVYGGNAGRGGQGGAGGTGGSGKSVVNIISGTKDGSKNYGGRGGNGGNGGDGGAVGSAIDCAHIVINGVRVSVSNATLIYAEDGIGSLGGNGGNGGTGGRGGNYWNSFGSVWRCSGGSGGNGGNAGTGSLGRGTPGYGGSIGSTGNGDPVNGIGGGINWGSVFYDEENNPTHGTNGS